MTSTHRTNGGKRTAQRILVGKREGKRPLRSPRRRFVDNIKIDLRKIGWSGIDWINLVDRDDVLGSYIKFCDILV
jgi:hypothetical protein